MALSQWKTISESLATQITGGELNPGDRIPGEEDLAVQWRVSRQTAHKAVQELQRMGLVVRKRRWGTVVAGREIRRTGRVALLVDLFAQEQGFPQPDLIRGIQDALGDEIRLMVVESKHEGDREIRNLRQLHDEVDGVLLWPVNDPKNTPIIQRMIDLRFPMVLLDRIPAGLKADVVMSDNVDASLKAMRALEERGHRRIGFFGFHRPEFSSVIERHHAYVCALEEVGIHDSARYERWFLRDLESDPEYFVQAVSDALFALTRQEEPITALFCVQDALAVAAYRACDRFGLKIPDDLELATFNDWPSMLLRSPWSMHRIVQRSYDIGRRGAELLLQRIEGSTQEFFTERIAADFFVSDAGLRPNVSDRLVSRN